MSDTVIVHGPAGCGKTHNKLLIAAHFGCKEIIDEWRVKNPKEPLVDGALHLTTLTPKPTRWAHIVAYEDLDFVEHRPFPVPATPSLPEGDYAIVEIMGHRTMIGRIEEIERFGMKLMQIEPIFDGWLLSPVIIGGASIYQLTPCTADVALKRAPKNAWQLPPSIVATLPPSALPAPEGDEHPF